MNVYVVIATQYDTETGNMFGMQVLKTCYSNQDQAMEEMERLERESKAVDWIEYTVRTLELV